MPTESYTPSEAGRLPERLAQAPAGTRFELAAGRYQVPALVVRADVALVGAGREATAIELLERALVVEGGGLSMTGVTLRGGHNVSGGGVEVINGGRLRLERCTLADNEATRIGGAVHVEQGSAVITRCLFAGNRAPAGAALSAHRGSTLEVDRALFLDHTAQVGGALMVNVDAKVVVRSCTFARNQALLEEEEGGAAVALLGTAGSRPEVRLINCLFCDPRPLANRPLKPGRLALASCLLPPGSLARVELEDGGRNLEAEARLAEVEELPALAPSSPGHRAADVAQIERDALDLLGRPLVVDGEADVGALGLLDGGRR